MTAAASGASSADLTLPIRTAREAPRSSDDTESGNGRYTPRFDELDNAGETDATSVERQDCPETPLSTEYALCKDQDARLDRPLEDVEEEQTAPEQQNDSNTPSLSQLPLELMLMIFELLPPPSIMCLGATCRGLYNLARTESLWRNVLRAELGQAPPSLYPFDNCYDLYRSMDPFWFLVRQGIWFSDTGLSGSLLLTRFDHRTGTLESFQLMAEREHLPTTHIYEWGEPLGGSGDLAETIHNVVTYTSTWPTPRLQMDMPFFRFRARPDGANVLLAPGAVGSRFGTKLTLANESVITSVIKVSLQLAANLPAEPCPPDRPSWPPALIPSPARVSAFPEGLRTPYHLRPQDVPETRTDISEHTFRIVRQRHSGPNSDHQAWYMSFSTIERVLWTPTERHPWRGIWAGNYGQHGCEFLLFHQPGNDLPDALQPPHEREQPLTAQWERDSVWEWRRREPATHCSELIAVKLTGDPNVPRGECSFYVPDLTNVKMVPGNTPLGEEGEKVRAVESRGHVAGHGYREDSWVPGWVALLSPDRIAHVMGDAGPAGGAVIFLQRVDIDGLRRV